MAISSVHVRLLRSIQPLLPHGGRLLEIGEANWYGNSTPDFPVPNFFCDAPENFFAIAKAFYADLFAPREVVSVDAQGTKPALRQDLNWPLSLGEEPFDIAINHGTAEHIFNIGQVFCSMHDATRVSGLMVHESPFTGWVDHGFYNLQPTLFYDLAMVNGYEIVLAAAEHIDSDTAINLDSRDHAASLASSGELPNNSMLFIVFRKTVDHPFRIPQQGYYAATLSQQGMMAWSELR